MSILETEVWYRLIIIQFGGLFLIALLSYSFYDILRNKNLKHKVIWFITVILLPIIGIVLYWNFRSKNNVALNEE